MNSQLNFFEKANGNATWKEVLQGEKDSDYFRKLMNFIERERALGKIIYPKAAEVFSALSSTPFEGVKVVIIGQDPYHGPNQAHGLCFSVKPGVSFPPSLVNIFKELSSDLGIPMPQNGHLEKWALQGVLLLNAVLTVEAGRPQSHSNIGWERFTDRIIKEINDRRKGVVFLLWGSQAIQKAKEVDTSKHFILTAPHPSPLSAHRGFLGCKHFSKTNEILKKLGRPEVDWSL